MSAYLLTPEDAAIMRRLALRDNAAMLVKWQPALHNIQRDWAIMRSLVRGTVNHKRLTVAIARVNDCKSSLHTEWQKSNRSYAQKVIFQGFECDVIVCRGMYEYLTTTIERLCSEDQKLHRTTKSYQASIGTAFKWGAAAEIVKRLNDLQKERRDQLFLQHRPGTSLVVYKMAQVEAEFGKFETGKSRGIIPKAHSESFARERGREAGRSVNLDPQIAYSDSKAMTSQPRGFIK